MGEGEKIPGRGVRRKDEGGESEGAGRCREGRAGREGDMEGERAWKGRATSCLLERRGEEPRHAKVSEGKPAREGRQSASV